MSRLADWRPDVRCMRELFDSCFLHDGHIGGRSSSRSAFFGSGVASPPLSVAGVDSIERPDDAAELSNVHFTEIKFFRLHPLSQHGSE